MDLVCTRCGEPWSLDYVLHDEPEAFDREGGLIRRCPCCPKGEPNLPLKERERLAAVRELTAVMIADFDSVAAALEDSNLFSPDEPRRRACMPAGLIENQGTTTDKNNETTAIKSIEVRDLTVDVTRYEFGSKHASYCVEIKLWPEDLLSEEEPQYLVLDFRNLLRLETAVRQAVHAITHDRNEQRALKVLSIPSPTNNGGE